MSDDFFRPCFCPEPLRGLGAQKEAQVWGFRLDALVIWKVTNVTMKLVSANQHHWQYPSQICEFARRKVEEASEEFSTRLFLIFNCYSILYNILTYYSWLYSSSFIIFTLHQLRNMWPQWSRQNLPLESRISRISRQAMECSTLCVYSIRLKVEPLE